MKTAIITGANQGLGKSITLKLAKLGYELVLLARSEKSLKEVCSEVEKIGGKATYHICDISEPKEVDRIVKEISSKYSKIDLLVNNAGIWTDDELQETDPGRRTKAVQTNLLGPIYLTEAVLSLLKNENITRIFNVISTAGIEGIPAGNNTSWKTYGASKWGFKGYTTALRESLRNSNVQVLQFFPGGFESNLYENAGRSNPHNQLWMMKTDDVADIAVFAITRPDDVYIEQVVVSKFMQQSK